MNVDPHEEAENLLTFDLGQTLVEAGTEPLDQFHGFSRRRVLGGVNGRQPPLDVGPVRGDRCQFGPDLDVGEVPEPSLAQDRSPPFVESSEGSFQRDRVRFPDRLSRFLLAPPVELVEDLARIAQEALDIRPNETFEPIAPDRGVRAASRMRAALD